MRALVVAVILALALGFTVKDMATDSAASPGDSWESRATAFDESMGVSETGGAMREWLFESLGESDPRKY